MISHYHQPCCYIRLFGITYNQMQGRVRQKMSLLNQKLIQLNRISGMQYFMYVDQDTLTLINATYDRIVFNIPVHPSLAICLFKLDQIIEMHRLEHDPITTIYEYNHYQSLKKQFYP